MDDQYWNWYTLAPLIAAQHCVVRKTIQTLSDHWQWWEQHKSTFNWQNFLWDKSALPLNNNIQFDSLMSGLHDQSAAIIGVKRIDKTSVPSLVSGTWLKVRTGSRFTKCGLVEFLTIFNYVWGNSVWSGSDFQSSSTMKAMRSYRKWWSEDGINSYPSFRALAPCWVSIPGRVLRTNYLACPGWLFVPPLNVGIGPKASN